MELDAEDEAAGASQTEALMAVPTDAGTPVGLERKPDVPFDQRLVRVVWLVLLATIAGWAIIYLSWPFSTDQGMLSWVGEVIRSGGTPYEDTWETRGPFPYFLYALVAAVAGPNEWALRILDLVFVTIASFSLWRAARSLEQPIAARIAVVIYLLWYAAQNHHNAAQSDGWNGAMLAGAVALLLGRGLQPPSWFATMGAGLTFGLCILSKPTYGVMLAIPLLHGISIARRHGVAALAKYWGLGAAGLILAIAACLGWYAQRGALDEMIDVHIRWTLAHYPALSAGWLNRIHYMLQYLSGGPLTAALPFALVGIGSLWRMRSDAAVIIATWLGCTFLTVMVQGEFFPYHWNPVYPALALPTGLGIYTAYVFWTERRSQALIRLFPAAMVVLFIAVAMEPAMHLYRWVSMTAGLSSREEYERVEFGPYGKQTGVFSEVTRYVRDHSSAGEPILVWGNPAGIYYLADRPAAARFGYPAALLAGSDDFSRRYQAEFLAGLQQSAPRLIVALDDSICQRAPSIEARKLVGKAEGLMDCLSALPPLRTFTDTSYTLDQRFGNIVIWHRMSSRVPIR